MKISVVMLAYNAEKTIEESIKSVLGQMYSDFEFLIINDASTDKTEQIIKEYANNDARIRYHKNEQNCGVAFSRELGAELSEGEYVAFIDSDDLWTEDKLSSQVELIKENENAEFVFTGSAFIDSCGNVKKHILNVPEKVTYRKLLGQNIISCSSVLIKRTHLLGAFVPDDSMHEDFAAWLKILKKGVVAYGINKPLLVYRVSAGSRSYNKLKAAKMTLKVYRHMKLGIFLQVYYMCIYAVKGVKKYSKIYE